MALCRGHDRRQAPSGTQGNHLLRPQRHHGRAGGPREGARESGKRAHAGGVARRARRLRRIFWHLFGRRACWHGHAPPPRERATREPGAPRPPASRRRASGDREVQHAEPCCIQDAGVIGSSAFADDGGRGRCMDVLMPQLGETVAEGKITKWFKSAGDAIKPGDNLFEIETDKVSMEVPSTTAGVLAEIRVGEGEVAPVGAIVAVIADGAGAAPGAQPAVASASKPAAVAPPQTSPPSPARAAGSAAAAPAPTVAAPIKLDPFFEVRTPARNYGPAQLPGGTRVTPLARRLAAEGGIDLGKISPSGPHGRIVARDIEAARPVAARAAPTPAAGMTADQVKALYRDAPYEEVPLDGMRKTIAARLVMAAQTIPHFYLTTDVEIGALIKL